VKFPLLRIISITSTKARLEQAKLPNQELHMHRK